MGAPAHRKVRKVGTRVLPSATFLARSLRNGVEAIVKVTPSLRISSMAFFGSQTSCSTTLARSTMGIISPYMKPVWCAIGEAIRTTSLLPSCRRWA